MALDVGADPATVTTLMQKMALPSNPAGSASSALPPPAPVTQKPYPGQNGDADGDEVQPPKPKKAKKEKPAVTRQ